MKSVSARKLSAQDNAELVAFGVREHNVVGISGLPNVDVLGPELDESVDELSLVFDSDSLTKSRWIGFFAVFDRERGGSPS